MKTATSSLLIAAFAALWSATALAGTPVSSSKSVVIPPEPPEKAWYLTVAVYGWLSAVEGDTGIGPVAVSADTSLNDLIDEFDGSFMTYIEAGCDRWSFGLDIIWGKLKDDASITRGPFFGRAGFEQEQAIITGRIQYAVVKNDTTRVDIFAGGRWMYLEVDIDIDTNLGPGRHFGIEEDWIDPIVGARVIHDFSDKCFVQAMGDVGGFGVESEVTWQALLGLGYRFTPKLSSVIGYRALGIDYDQDNFVLDTISHGPFVGLSYSF
ncbi:MAG TPA: hypothetical protein VLE43_18385 [Candidatus Saccharimonadia bacterium]|nr:hypothetical protein [Candidatus Saccharimonadia bacterium]